MLRERPGAPKCVLLFCCLLAAWAATGADAFSVSGPVVYDPTESHWCPTGAPNGHTCSATLNPANADYLPEPTPRMMAALQAEFPNYTFTAGWILCGNLEILSYYARDDTPCPSGRMGAKMEMVFTPGTGDPLNLRWAQLFDSDMSGRHIDPYPNDDDKPFYYTDEQEKTYGLRFVDHPSRPCPCPVGHGHTEFETYLCSYNEGDPTQVIVHDGIRWGYDVDCFIPEPGSFLALVCGIAALAGYARRRAR